MGPGLEPALGGAGGAAAARPDTPHDHPVSLWPHSPGGGGLPGADAGGPAGRPGQPQPAALGHGAGGDHADLRGGVCLRPPAGAGEGGGGGAEVVGVGSVSQPAMALGVVAPRG